MIQHDRNGLLFQEEKFKQDFQQNVIMPEFIEQERNWIRKNLDFIYSNKLEEVNLMIHPFCRFIEVDSFSEDKFCKEKYILLPKYLSLGQLHIHTGQLDKADKMIYLMKNYNYQFTLSEIYNAILSNCNTIKEDILKKQLTTIINKFLSYQYLVIN